MRNLRVITILLLCVLLLGACGSNKEVSNNVTGNETTQTENQNESKVEGANQSESQIVSDEEETEQSGNESAGNENGINQIAVNEPPQGWEPNPVSDFDYKYSDELLGYSDELQGLVVSYKGTSEKVWFPTEINGDPVVAIRFMQSPEVVKEVYIPEGITVIDQLAFSQCINLRSIVIPEGVTEIGDSAFFNCKNLSNVVLPDSVTKIGNIAFYMCNSLTSFRFPPNLKVIGRTAFKNVPLTEIILPEGLEVIKEIAFEECNELTSIVIPRSVKRIELWAFHNCKNLAQITLADQDAVLDIGYSAFNGTYWYNMQPEGFIKLGGNLITHKGQITDTKLVIPDGIRSIAQYINSKEVIEIENVTEVVLPEGLKIIGEGAFRDAKMLKTINIPDSVEYIGDDAFGRCRQLDEAAKERIKQLNPNAVWD